MHEPVLTTTMRRHPAWHVMVHNPRGDEYAGTTASGFLTEYEAAIEAAKAQGRAEGWDAARTHFLVPVNPYRQEATHA